LENFASYYGEHSLSLDCTEDKPVIVVLGRNGYGKTSLFDALNWALYGSDYELQLPERRERDIADYVNSRALREAAADGKSLEMSSTLYFEHDGVHYYITQALRVRPVRETDGQIQTSVVDRFTALNEIGHDGDHRQLDYSTIFLDEILPNNVKDYFLFDGDRIYNLSNPGFSKEVRNAIYRVVDLELISNAVEHLTSVAKEYGRNAQREATDELSRVKSRSLEAGDARDKLARDLEVQREEERAIKDQIEVLEGRLADLPDTSELQARRKDLERRYAEAGRARDETTVEMRRLCGTAALVLARDSIVDLTAQLEAQRQKGMIPRKVSQTLLKDLLQMHRCVCGTEFEDGDPIYQTLASRLEAEQQRTSDQALLELLFQLRSTSDLVNNAARDLANKDEEASRYEEARRALDMAISEVDAELDKMPQEDVAQLRRGLKERRDGLQNTTRKQQRLQDQIEQLDNEISNLEKRADDLAARQGKVQRLQAREKLARRAASVLDEMYDRFAEDSRRAVEDLTKREFAEFMESARGYGVALSQDYELQVLDSNGNRALQRLSMGQSQCLSLSFITAIARVSEKNPPIVIDMPFGRLDSGVHSAVSGRLPEITSQLVLFLLPDVEWNEHTSKNLRWKASHVYQLQYDPKIEESNIQELR
jgi:DNA sulfur modification protein DndD